jgi:hypothetical protein
LTVVAVVDEHAIASGDEQFGAVRFVGDTPDAVKYVAFIPDRTYIPTAPTF